MTSVAFSSLVQIDESEQVSLWSHGSDRSSVVDRRVSLSDHDAVSYSPLQMLQLMKYKLRDESKFWL